MEKGAKKRGYTKKEKTLLGICISFISLWSLVRSLSALRIWLSLHYASRFYFIIIYIFLLPLPFFFFGIPFICCVCWANIIERPSLLLLISLCALSFQIHLNRKEGSVLRNTLENLRWHWNAEADRHTKIVTYY